MILASSPATKTDEISPRGVTDTRPEWRLSAVPEAAVTRPTLELLHIQYDGR
jgi:hypothetical protein